MVKRAKRVNISGDGGETGRSSPPSAISPPNPLPLFPAFFLPIVFVTEDPGLTGRTISLEVPKSV